VPFDVIELVLLAFDPVGGDAGTIAQPEVKEFTVNFLSWLVLRATTVAPMYAAN
jgi:hypothetical protein